MDSNNQQTREINLKALFFVILKKSGIILVVGVILAAGLFCFKMIHNNKNADILDASQRLDGETDVEYSERVLNIQRAEDIINSIDALNGQIENQRQYMTESILMQINAENEAVTTANVVVTVNGNPTSGIDKAILASYSQDLLSGDYLTGLAEELDTDQGYLLELIKVDYSPSSSVVVDPAGDFGSAGTITITVIGPSADYSEQIMDLILDEINTVSAELNDSIAPHSIVVSGKQTFYKVDNNTRDLQYNAINRFETIQKQITTYDDSLKEIASDLGVDNKDSLYSYFSFNSNEQKQTSMGGAIKFAVIGFAAGVFIVLCAVVVDYLFGKKFASQSKFFGRFPKIKRIGVIKPEKKRSAFAVFVDRKTGDDNELTDDNNLKLIAANVKNLTVGMNTVLFTGTSETERINALVSKLGVKADVKESFFTDPACLELISKYDGVIIVEQRNHSDIRLISEELELIDNTNTQLVGAIII